jgi:hypothetical protein
MPPRRFNPNMWCQDFLPSDRVVASEPTSNTEAEIICCFGYELLHKLGRMNDTCSSCGALHWKEERTMADMNKPTALFLMCCQKGAEVRPVQYSTEDYTPQIKALFTGTDNGKHVESDNRKHIIHVTDTQHYTPTE